MAKSPLITKINFFPVLSIVVLLTSCGSYQQASYYWDDGIYPSGNRVARVEKKSYEAVETEKRESDIYGDYFGQKAEEYGEILEDEVFTDIESYSSTVTNGSIPLEEQTDYFTNNTYQGNPAWGDNPTNLTINVYDNWGWNNPWLWNGWGWGGLGWGWGWNNPWRWNRWGWGSFGWSYAGFYGWNSPYWYGSGYYGNGGYAFNRSRRGYSNNVIPGTTLRGGRSNIASRTRGYASTRPSVGRSNVGRSSRTYRSSTARRNISADAAARNRSYRTSRNTRTSPRTSRSYGTSPSTRSSRTYRTGSSSGTSSRYGTGGRSTRSYQSDRQTAPRSSSNYNKSSRSYNSSRSYGSPSRSSRSSGNFRSYGGNRSFSGRSSGGRSGGRRR